MKRKDREKNQEEEEKIRGRERGREDKGIGEKMRQRMLKRLPGVSLKI